MPRYELSEGNSSKFWAIELAGSSFTTTYGRLGTDGQSTVKEWDSNEKAKKEYEKLIVEKVKKGYELVGGAAGPEPKAKKKTTAVAAPKSAAAGKKLTFVAEASIRAIKVSPDGRWIAASQENQHVTLWDASTGEQVWSKRAGGAGMKFVTALAFSPDGRFVASGASSIKIFEVDGGKEVDGLPGHPKGELVALSWGETGLASASAMRVQKADNSVALWDVAKAKLLKQWPLDNPQNVQLVASKKAALIVFTDFGSFLNRIDAASGAIVTRKCEEYAVAYATDEGIWLGNEEQLQLLDLESLEVKRTIKSSSGALTGVDSSGSILVTTDDDNFWRIDAKTGKKLAEWKAPARIPGILEHVEAIRAKSGGHVDRYDDETPRIVDVAVTKDRVVAATAWAIAVWSIDGKPLVLPSAR